MSIRAFELFGEVSLKNKTSAELKKVDRDLVATTSHFRTLGREIDGVSSKGRGMSSSFSGLGSFLGRAGSTALGNLASSALSAATGGIKSAIEQGKEYNQQLEQSMIGFETLLGSKAAAIQHIRELEAFAFKTPFTSMELFKLSPYLQAVGFEAKQVIPLLTSVGDALALSGNSANLERVIRQLGQMKSLGVIHFEEMNILAENGIPVWQLLAEAMAKPGEKVDELKAKLMKLGSTGQLLSEDVLPVLMAQLDKKYGGGMERVALTTQYGVKSSEEDVKQKLAAEGLRGTQDYVFTGGAYGAETERSRQRTAAYQGPLGDDLRKTVSVGGSIYGSLADWLQGQLIKPLAGQDTLVGKLGKMPPKEAIAGWLEELKGRESLLGKLTGGTLGDDIVGPLLNSLKGGVAAAGTAAADLGSAIMAGLDSIWQWGSPSKKAIQLGIWISEGLELGLTKGQGRNYANLKALTQADPNFIKTLVAESAKRGVNPDDMLNLMSIESGFNKSVVNQFGYGGLGQVGRNERGDLGLPVGDAAFKEMLESHSASWQLQNVIFPMLDKKLKENPGILAGGATLSEIYGAWGSGHATGDPNAVHMVKGGKRAAAYANNPLWDPNKDGIVREGEFGTAAMNSLGAGKFFSVNGGQVSSTNPMPVAVVASAFSGASGSAEGWRPFVPAAARDKFITSKRGSRSTSQETVDGPFPIAIEVQAALEPLTQTFNEFNMATTLTLRPLQELIKLSKEQQEFADREVADEKAKQGAAATDAAARLRRQMDAAGAATNDKKAFSLTNIGGDFQGGLQSMLANMGWQKPTSLFKEFGLGLLKNIQGLIASDMSAMVTGSLFGNRKGGTGADANNLTGGLLQTLFGSLFGGHRASGGAMEAGRMYVAGEHGQELIAGPGHVYNARETRAMMGGGGEQRIIFALGDKAVAEAIEHHRTQPSSRRSRLIEGKWFRKLQSVSY